MELKLVDAFPLKVLRFLEFVGIVEFGGFNSDHFDKNTAEFRILFSLVAKYLFNEFRNFVEKWLLAAESVPTPSSNDAKHVKIVNSKFAWVQFFLHSA